MSREEVARDGQRRPGQGGSRSARDRAARCVEVISRIARRGRDVKRSRSSAFIMSRALSVNTHATDSAGSSPRTQAPDVSVCGRLLRFAARIRDRLGRGTRASAMTTLRTERSSSAIAM